jgi:hypothetical protein
LSLKPTLIPISPSNRKTFPPLWRADAQIFPRSFNIPVIFVDCR